MPTIDSGGQAIHDLEAGGGEEHPLLWTDPETFWGVAETFLAR